MTEIMRRMIEIKKKRRLSGESFVIDGGEGSGNFNHAGRPGEVGGSSPDDSSSKTSPLGRKEIKNKISNLPSFDGGEGSRKDLKKTPFDLVDRETRIRLAEEEGVYNREENTVGNVDIDISKLMTKQPMVMEKHLKDMIDSGVPFGPTETQDIVVVLMDGKYVIIDGNHRATLAKISGQNKLRVNLKKLP